MHETSEDRPHCITFGVFELDPRSGELRKSGARLNLQHQPLQLLSVLLERPGELVTRDELRKRLWPEDTFVDFEHGLNAAVKRLRDVLGDSADSPRFVETVPRRGYRFIAPANVPRPADSPADRGSARQRRWSRAELIAGVLAAAALAAGVWALVSPKRQERGAMVSASGPTGPMLRLTTGAQLDTEPTISRDGESIAYASDRSGEGDLDIWMQRLSGGEPVRLTRDPADDREPTFSADGSRIAFRSERDGGGIYVIPAHSGGQPVRLEGGEAHGPRFSPDGRWLAYSTGPGRFSTDKAWPHGGTHTYLMPSTGGKSMRLLPDLFTVAWPIWSPDGRHVLLTVGRKVGEPPEWWVVAVEGQASVGTAVQVSRGVSRFPMRAWSWTEENSIVYSASLGGDSWNLYEVPIQPGTWKTAGEPRRLTTGADLQAHAAIVRGKQQLLFASLIQTVNVWSVALHANTGRVVGPLQRVTATAALQMVPSASEDGRRLVFTADKPEPFGLWVRDLDRDRETLLVPSRVGSPSITADGSRVAFYSNTGGNDVIYTLPTSGGVPETLCADCSPRQLGGWSSDGTRLLFGAGSPIGISVLDLRSGGRSPVFLRAHDLWQAQFSPDDLWMSAVEVVSQNRTRIWIAPSTKAATPPDEAVSVTNGDFWDDKPRWSPDGNLLYFTSFRDGFHCLWAQRLWPETKQPVGAAFSVHHFHSARLSMNITGFGGLAMAVARDRIFINPGELTGSIWTTRLDSRSGG
jgi:Tol biopolymer transport system component/DNA-binding winged helix-turn-helix (wHTH) protein